MAEKAQVSLPISQLYNNFALGHVIFSDDGGDTWNLSSKDGLGGGANHGSMGANRTNSATVKRISANEFTP